jgi:hypothetical protein
MCVRHHRAVHGIKADAPERAMEHGNSFTHRPPIGILLVLFGCDYIGLYLRGKWSQSRRAKCA